MDKRELAIMSAQVEIDRFSKDLEKRVERLQYTLENELQKENGMNAYVVATEDVRQALEGLIGAKKVLRALEGLE